MPRSERHIGNFILRSLTKSPPNHPLASGRGTNACSTGLTALEHQHGMSKRHQHDGRGFRRVSHDHSDSFRILANHSGDRRDLVAGPSGAARVGALLAKTIVLRSPHPTAEYVLPARPRDPVPCSTGAQAWRLNPRGEL